MDAQAAYPGDGKWCLAWPACRKALFALLLLLAGLSLAVAQQPADKPGSAVSPGAASAASDAAGTAAAPGDAASGQSTQGMAAWLVEPNQLDFGRQRIDTSSAVRTVTLSADPQATSASTYAVKVQGDFHVAPESCTLAAKGSCALSISFAPTKTGETTGALVVSPSPGGPNRVAVQLAGTGVRAHERLNAGGRGGPDAIWPVLLLAALYGLAVIAVRWNMVAQPANEDLRAEIDMAAAHCAALRRLPRHETAGLDHVDALLRQARARLGQGDGEAWLWNICFWSRGQDRAGWTLVHEAKEYLAAASPPNEVRVALDDAEVQLRETKTARAVALAERIRTELANTELDLSDYPAALLREVLAFLQWTAADVAQDLVGLADAAASAKAADMAALAQRLLNTLAPHQALADQIRIALQPDPSGMPGAFRALLEDARDMLLDQAARACAALAAPLPADEAGVAPAWRDRLDGFRHDFLPQAIELRAQIERALASAPIPPSRRRSALLAEAKNQLYEQEDREFLIVASSHKKTLWFVGTALLLITALSATVGNAVFFLLGATGGFASRLMRVLGRQQQPTDIAGAWTTLFLSPVAGAVGGWMGVLLVVLAVKWQLLGDLFQSVRWDDPYGEMALALALVFGISERMLVTVIEGLEGKLGVQPTAGAKADASTTTPAAAPPQPLSITTAESLKAVKGASFGKPLSAAGGTQNYSWSAKPIDGPGEGLTLDPSGFLYGSPKTAGARTFTLVVTDGAGAVCEKRVTLTVSET